MGFEARRTHTQPKKSDSGFKFILAKAECEGHSEVRHCEEKQLQTFDALFSSVSQSNVCAFFCA